MGISLSEAIQLLSEGEELTLECDGYIYNVGPSENYLGGEEGGYISDALGNIVYDDPEVIIKETIKFLSGSYGKQVKISM